MEPASWFSITHCVTLPGDSRERVSINSKLRTGWASGICSQPTGGEHGGDIKNIFSGLGGNRWPSLNTLGTCMHSQTWIRNPFLFYFLSYRSDNNNSHAHTGNTMYCINACTPCVLLYTHTRVCVCVCCVVCQECLKIIFMFYQYKLYYIYDYEPVTKGAPA